MTSPTPFRNISLSLSVLTITMLAGFLLSAPSAQAADEVNIYSYRQPFLIKPLMDAFTRATGTKVNLVYIKKGMLERIKAEGVNTAADVILSSDVGRLNDMVLADLLAPTDSALLKQNIPAQYRHPQGKWYGLTTRARIVFASKENTKEGEVTTYEDLTKPELKGRVCIRSGKHVYNISLIASIIAHKGVAGAEAWLKGLKANLARKPQGNDRAQAKAIYQGVCDYGIANTYYYAKMATNSKKPVQKKWAAAIRLIFPNQKGRGAHFNISGAGIIKHSKHKAAALKLVEFLSSDAAQKIYAEQNFEYPVKKGVPLHPIVKSWGIPKADTISLDKVASLRAEAARLVDRTGFDQ